MSELRTKLLPIVARRTSRPAITGNNRLLILQPDHLGDIILSQPAVRYLREMLPDRELIAVVGPWSAEITEMAWPVDRIVTVEFPGFSRSSSSDSLVEPYAYLRRTASLLRSLEADDAIVLRDDAWWSAWLARASVGRYVFTSDDHRTRQFSTCTASGFGSKHRTAIAMDIVLTYLLSQGQILGTDGWDMSPRVRLDVDDHYEGQALLSTPPNGNPAIVIHPGSGAEVKTWPAEHWKAVIREIPGFNVILTGSKSEQPVCEGIAEDFPHTTSLAGATTLPGLAALLKNTTLAIGTDNGPMHLAGALGVPTIRLFGPSNPDRYGPWPDTPGQTVIHAGWTCPRCEDLSPARPAGCGCMLGITPRQVLDNVLKAVERAA